MVRCECLQCGYDLSALVKSVRVEATCPECGHVGVPVPANFMGRLKSRRRTLFYMLLPVLIAAGLVIALRLVGFAAYGLPLLVVAPAAVVVPLVVCTAREWRARGRPVWAESLWLMLGTWAAQLAIGVIVMWVARVM